MKISMKIGTQKTDTAKFGGFGMKIGGSTSAASAARPGGLSLPAARPGSAAARAKAASGGMSSAFREAMEDDEEQAAAQKMGVPQWSKPTLEAVAAQRHADKLLAEDATVFQYDEVIDDEKRAMDIEVAPETVRLAALDQKKRVGLHQPEGSENVRSGAKREAKYIEKVLVTTDRRKVEQQIVEDRLLKKEQDAREGREVFITGAFKEELKRRKKFEDELEEQELKDERKDATKMENGQGFADFHRKLLNDGKSSARAGKDIAVKKVEAVTSSLFQSGYAPAAAPAKDEEVKKEDPMDEDDDKSKVDASVKAEDGKEETPDHGVQDVQGPPMDPNAKKAALLAEQEQRAEKSMSAKERFLARKRAAADAATE